jgi:NitT/TauT family transport system ATP-binding protein
VRVILDHVSKTYADRRGHEVHALDDVSASVAAEEFVALLGPSGCGKSTLLNIVAGLLAPTRGDVYFEGEADDREQAARDDRGPVARDDRGPVDSPPTSFTRPLVSMVFQEFALFPWRTVQKNVEFGLEEAGVPAAERAREASRYIELTGLAGFEAKYPHQLSGGMRQRVGIARALAVDPAVLLMDEPFSALDAQTRQLMQEELLAIWERTRKTIVYVTHNIQEAVYMADRVIVLSRRPGRVLAEITIELKRPRTETMIGEPAFVRAAEQIWSLIKDQAREALRE